VNSLYYTLSTVPTYFTVKTYEPCVNGVPGTPTYNPVRHTDLGAIQKCVTCDRADGKNRPDSVTVTISEITVIRHELAKFIS
jgi:hypothetical protein